MTYHPSIYVTGLIAFVLLAHNQSVKMQAVGVLVMLASTVFFLWCRSGKAEKGVFER